MADTENVAPEVVVEDKNVEIKEEETENGSTQESTDNLTKLETDIIRQIEYYFSECNLNRDKFLRGKIDENPDNWVEISVLLTFNRLKAITEDPKVIVDALEKATSGLVQISEDKLKLRRHPDNPLPEFNEERRKELSRRTAYAKGFPLDSKMDTLVEYFNSNFQKVQNVVMRKYYDSKTKLYKFKGSVFILFETREQAEEFVKKEGLKYGEKELLRYMQEEYFEVKKNEKSKKDEKKKAKKAEQQAAEDDIVLPKNAVVHFNGIEGSISREDIRKRVLEINPALTIAFIHFERGDKQGELRFSKENDGKEFIEKLEGGKLKLNDFELNLSLLEGEEEEAFLKKALEDMKKARQRGNQKFKGRGGRYNKSNDRKRKNEDKDNQDEAPAKHAREDEAVPVTATE